MPDITTALPEDVPAQMEDMVNRYNQVQPPTVENLAAFHAEYENIHPFQDGNGRTGRMILFRESLRRGMVPIIIRSENKLRYIRCLNHAQTNGKVQELAEYLREEQDAFYEETNLVIEIGELVGRITEKENLSVNSKLRRNNRIRTIYSSLAIEQNTMSLEQVSDVIEGKRVLAPPKDIREVKNAYEAYEELQNMK